MNSREKIELELAVACGAGDLGLVKTLLASNEELLGLNFMRDSPLLVACRRGQLKVVEFLISCGADVNVISGGETPLLLAISSRNIAMVRELLKAGAYPDYVEDEVGSALALAAKMNCPDIVIELLNFGAHLDAPCYTGWRAIGYVVLVDSEHLCDEVCKKPNWFDIEPWPSKPLVNWLARKGRQEYLLRAVSSGVDINGFSAGELTPLHEACEGGMIETVRTLLELGANPNLGVAQDKTPFHSAVAAGEVNCALAVMEHLGLTVLDDVYGRKLLDWVEHDPAASEQVQRLVRGVQAMNELSNVFNDQSIGSLPVVRGRQGQGQML